MSQSDELDEILEQLQYGTIMSDNQEPQLTNNRNIAKQAIDTYTADKEIRARLVELDLLEQALNANDWNDLTEYKLYRLEDLTNRLEALKANKEEK